MRASVRIAALCALAAAACVKKQVAYEAETVAPAADDPSPRSEATTGVAAGGQSAGIVAQGASKLDTIKAARHAASLSMKAGGFKAAVETLERAGCAWDYDEPTPEALEVALCLSDLSFAYYKAGRPRECLSLAGSELPPYAGNIGAVFDEDHGVVKALTHSETLCEQEVARSFADFAQTQCSLTTGAAGMPPGTLPDGASEACIQLAPGKLEDELFVPGDVILHVKIEDTVSVRKMSFARAGDEPEDQGPFALNACNIDSVSFAKRSGVVLMLLAGGGRDCSGGTASSSFRLVYALRGAVFELVDKHEVVAH